jgi:hypothetical protein
MVLVATSSQYDSFILCWCKLPLLQGTFDVKPYSNSNSSRTGPSLCPDPAKYLPLPSWRSSCSNSLPTWPFRFRLLATLPRWVHVNSWDFLGIVVTCCYLLRRCVNFHGSIRSILLSFSQCAALCLKFLCLEKAVEIDCF